MYQQVMCHSKTNITSQNGQRFQVRALLDSASQTSFITSDIVKKLKIKSDKVNLQISGISQTQKKGNGSS